VGTVGTYFTRFQNACKICGGHSHQAAELTVRSRGETGRTHCSSPSLNTACCSGGVPRFASGSSPPPETTYPGDLPSVVAGDTLRRFLPSTPSAKFFLRHYAIIEKQLWLRLTVWTNFDSGYADSECFPTRLQPLRLLVQLRVLRVLNMALSHAVAVLLSWRQNDIKTSCHCVATPRSPNLVYSCMDKPPSSNSSSNCKRLYTLERSEFTYVERIMPRTGSQ